MLDEQKMITLLHDLKKTDKSYTQIGKELGITKVAVRYWATRLIKNGNIIPVRVVGRKPRKI